MNKILRKIITVGLAVVCALSLVACKDNDNGGSEKGLLCKKIGDVYTVYKYVDDGETTVLDIQKELDELEIPTEYKDNIKIKAQAFSGNDSLTEIIVPASVTKIERGAFAGMKKLEKLTIPFVGLNANGDLYVNDTASSENKAVDAERTIAYIFGDTEYDEGISQTITYGLQDGQSSVCYVPVTLKEITVTAEKIPASAFNGMTKYVKVNLPNVKEIGEYALANCSQLAKMELPVTVEKIYKGAFSNSGLKEINLDALTALTVIAEGTFEGTALKSVTTPNSLKTIGKEAFFGCEELTTLNLNSGLEKIDRYAFMNCAKLAVITATGSIKVGHYAFADCEKLPSIPSAFDISGSVNAYPTNN